MKRWIFASLLSSFSLPALAQGARVCESVFAGSRHAEVADPFALDRPFPAPDVRNMETKPEKFDRLVDEISDSAFAELGRVLNDGQLDLLLRNTGTEVRETVEIAQNIMARHKELRSRTRLARLIPMLGRAALNKKFKAELSEDLNACRAQADVCHARLQSRAVEIESLSNELLRVETLFFRRENRIRELLLAFSPRFARVETWPESRARHLRLLDTMETERKLIEVMVGNLGVQMAGARESSQTLFASINQTLDALVMSGIRDIARLELHQPRLAPPGELKEPLTTMRQLAVISETGNRARRSNYKLAKRDLDNLNQIDTPKATAQMLWLLGEYGVAREREIGISYVSQRAFSPRTQDALEFALNKLPKEEGTKLLEGYLYRDQSSEATTAMIDLAYVYKHKRLFNARVPVEKILERRLGDEHLPQLEQAFADFSNVFWSEGRPGHLRTLIETIGKVGSPRSRAVLEMIAFSNWGQLSVDRTDLPYDTLASRMKRGEVLQSIKKIAADLLGSEHMTAVTHAGN